MARRSSALRCGSVSRTRDLWDMSPARYRLLYPAMLNPAEASTSRIREAQAPAGSYQVSELISVSIDPDFRSAGVQILTSWPAARR